MYEEAITVLEEHELPIEAADARVAYASALRQFDDVGAARSQLVIAHDAFERMGATGPCSWIAGVLEELASGAGRPGPARSV
jgi:hypothetical protein